MPIARFQMPDGRIGRFEVPDGLSDSEVSSLINQSLGETQTPEMRPIPNEPGFFRALKTGATSTAQSLFPAAKLMAAPGDEAAAEQLRQVGQTAQDAYRRTEFSEIGELAKSGDIGGALGATWSKFKELAGESIGFQAPAAAAGLAARVGVGAAAAAAGVAAAPAAAIGVGAYGLTLLGQYVASNLGRQVEENKGKPVERLPAAVAGSGQAALDLLGAKFLGLGKLLGLEGKAAAEQTVEQLVKAAQKPTRGQLAKTAGIGAAKGIGFEVPQEVAQSVLERWQAGLPTNPFDDPGAAKEYAEAAAGALMLGGPLGAIGRIGEQRRERGEAMTELQRRGDIEDAERQRLLAEAENAPRSEVFTGIPPEAPSGKPPKQASLFDNLPRAEAPGLEGMTPSGAVVEQPRSILGAAAAAEANVAELTAQRDELLRVRGLLDRETARASTPEQKVALQYQIKDIDTQLQDVQENLKKLGEKGPSKREAARFQQGELGPSTYFRDYPDVPEEPVPAAVEMENLRLTKDNVLGLFKKENQSRAKNTTIYKQLLGLDLTTTEGRSEFNRLMADADKRKVSSLDYGAVERLMTEAARYRDATTVVPSKGKLVEPTVIGEQPQPTGTLTPAQEAALEEIRTKGQQPGVELQRAQARQRQEGPSSIFVPEERQRQVGGLPILRPTAKPTPKAPSPTESWAPELVTDETLDKFDISKDEKKKPVAELRKALFGGRDLNNPEDAAAVREALRKYRSHALVPASQKSKVDQAIRSLGLAGQQSLDLFPRPEKETPRVDRPEAAGEGVVAPVLQRADRGRKAAGAGAAPVVGDQGRAGKAAGRTEPQQAALSQQDNVRRTVFSALSELNFDPKTIQQVLDEYTDNITGDLDIDGITQFVKDSTIEGEYSVVEETAMLMLERAEEKLSAAETARLEKHYGARKDSPEYQSKLREDIVAFINNGAASVAAAIRNIIRKLAVVVLSVGVVFNQGSFLSDAKAIPMPVPQTKAQVIQIIEKSKADFGQVKPSATVATVADWVIGDNNNQGKPFIVVDKPTAMAYAFDGDGKLEAVTPVLLGKNAMADVLPESALNKTVDQTAESEKVTPAGRFDATVEKSSSYGTSLRFMELPNANLAMHQTYLGTPAERRQQRLDTPTPTDNYVSYGCINVGAEFYNKHIRKPFSGGGVMYITPMTQNLNDTFKELATYSPTYTVVTETINNPQSASDVAAHSTQGAPRERQGRNQPKATKARRTRTNSRGQRIHPTDEGVLNFWRWFGDSKVVDEEGRPLVLYRGGVGAGEMSDAFLNAQPRDGYAVFASPSPYLASSYANPDHKYVNTEVGALVPIYVKADKLVEFPSRDGRFDMFEFDRRAQQLKPGEVLVVRDVYDTGPRASKETDPEQLYSYRSDVYAYGRGTQVKSAVSNTGAFSPTEKKILAGQEKPVGPKLNNTAATAVQAGDLRGALREISESGSTPMMRMVAKKLLGYVGQTKIKIGDVPGSGQYDPDTDTITINPNALHEHTVLHEMVHAAISHVLRNRFHPLTRELGSLYRKLLPRIQNTYGATSLQEFAAEAQSNPEFRAMLRNIRAPQGALKTAWDHIVDAVRKFLRLSPRQSQTALDKIDKVIDDLLTTAKVEPKTPGDILFLNANVSGSSAAYQQLLNSMGQQTRMLPEFTQGWFDSLGKLNRTLVGAVTKTLDMNHLAEIYGDRVPAIRGIINLLNERRGYENTQFDRAGKNARMLKRMYDKYKTSPKKEWDMFTDVIFDSTRTLYDPSAPSQSGNPEADAGPDIQNKWNRLPKDLQDAYRDIKDHYTAMYKDYMAALDKDLIALPDNERANIRAAIENKIKPYFPLMRFGDYWLEFERNGERYVTAFETPEERQRAIATLKLDRKSPGFKIYKKIEEVLSRPPSDPMIQRTLKALTDNGVDKETKDRVHRALLQLNPQQSAIFNMLKREGYEGFSRDLIRAYTTMTPRLISQTASRMYNRSIEETAGYARVQLEEISNATDEGYDALADAVAEELSGKQGSRLDVIMNPKPNKLASTMNWLTYGYFMGANVSTALINMTQTPMVAYPIMSSKFGIGNTTKALMDAYKFYGSHAFKNPIEKFKTHGYLSPLNTLPKGHPLANLYSELQRRGQINISITQELLDLQAQPTDKVSKTKQRVGVAMSFAHQMTEMSNREITAVAAYNLAKQAKMSEAQAIDYAIDVVTKSHGSGMMDTAGPIFQHPVGRVVLMFKRFAQLMVFRAARTAYVAIKGDASLSPQEQAEAMAMAKKQLLGIYLMAFAFAGAQGLPLYGLVEMLYNIFQSAFGDDMEYEDFTNMVREALGELAFKGPVNYATGRDIAQRTGFGDMLIRDDSRSMAELGPFMYYFQQFFGGAFLSAANNLNRGFGMINDGYVYRGLETMSPAVIRNAMKGARFWTEGATTIKGDPITDDLGVHDALFQMSGFAPTKLTEIYEKRGFVKEYETFIKDKRRRLLDQYEVARDSGDPDAMEAVRGNISRFNAAYPSVRITQDTIRQSIRGREQREREAIYGVQIDKRLRNQIKEAVAGGVE